MKSNKYDIVAITHRLFAEGERKKGGFDEILSFFSNMKGKSVLLIEHPLKGLGEGGSQSWDGAIISTIKYGKQEEIKRIELPKRINALSWINEVFFNVRFINNNISGNPIFLAADPLNSVTGVFLGNKVSKKYFHCIDYSDKRFNSFVLNCIYRATLFLVLKNFDIIGVVSLRIKKRLKEIANCGEKIIFIPNSPFFKQLTIPKKKNTLVCTGRSIIKKYDYERILDLVKALSAEFPDILLYAVGSLEDDQYVAKLKKKAQILGIEKNIVFTGFIKKENLVEIYHKAKLGICFFDEAVSYIYYADPLKTREYALHGIPIISDGKSGGDEEMVKEGCGFAIKNLSEAARKTALLLNNDSLYNKYRKNCLSWAKKLDKKRLLEDLQKLLFSE